MSDYFAAVNGRLPTIAPQSVGEFLGAFDCLSTVNVAYLAPHGNHQAERRRHRATRGHAGRARGDAAPGRGSARRRRRRPLERPRLHPEPLRGHRRARRALPAGCRCRRGLRDAHARLRRARGRGTARGRRDRPDERRRRARVASLVEDAGDPRAARRGARGGCRPHLRRVPVPRRQLAPRDGRAASLGPGRQRRRGGRAARRPRGPAASTAAAPRRDAAVARRSAGVEVGGGLERRRRRGAGRSRRGCLRVHDPRREPAERGSHPRQGRLRRGGRARADTARSAHGVVRRNLRRPLRASARLGLVRPLPRPPRARARRSQLGRGRPAPLDGCAPTASASPTAAGLRRAPQRTSPSSAPTRSSTVPPTASRASSRRAWCTCS